MEGSTGDRSERIVPTSSPAFALRRPAELRRGRYDAAPTEIDPPAGGFTASIFVLVEISNQFKRKEGNKHVYKIPLKTAVLQGLAHFHCLYSPSVESG